MNRLLGGADRGLGSLFGLGLALASLPLYRSYENRAVLGRWSWEFTGFALILTVIWFVLLLRAFRRRDTNGLPAHRLLARRFVEAGVLFWGIAYLISALRSRDSAARLLDLNFTGSTFPIAAVLEWCAVVAIVTGVTIRFAPVFRSRAAGVALSIVATIASIVLLEGVARAKAIIAPAPLGFPTYSGEIWEARHVGLNSAGFRDEEHSVTARPADRRLLVVGDSYAYGVGVRDPRNRFGEQLGRHLTSLTGARWETINASRPDTHTLQHLDFLKRALAYEPDLVVLLYVFNDIDYLRPVTERNRLSDGPSTFAQRFDPLLLLHRNSYLFQEALVRVRAVSPRSARQLADPYADSTVVKAHIEDIRRLVDLAEESGATAVVVPFDVSILAEPVLRERHDRFVALATTAGLPLWTVDGAFEGIEYAQLYVNRFDRHPNGYAYGLAAEYVAPRAAQALGDLIGDAARSGQASR